MFGACAALKEGNPSIKQGVSGNVLWLEGNVMPSPDVKNNGGGKPVVRKINIYEVTTANQVVGTAPLFTAINAKLVASFKSDKNGHFQFELPPGKYSIFTVEDDGQFFASLSDGNGDISPFEVKPNEVTIYHININYKAFY